ncbi:conserved protein of unknown function [Pseudodesulfovibrio piezophilus C1TLV30]|uniref:Lipid A biosynthesis domain protein n=1 Tax=Pseudodesulfovibrio piezophilus (strain DSM 21447 / JCM 15486 / C1TLV30) TaxID=1322246 RepID=M1WLL3_PSEP2|nr:conserved protein of unknown function [Pseudodesulfovibrio piezophilus C1TLV30]
MQLPAYWWLLALATVLQGAFFVRLCLVRMKRKTVHSFSRATMFVLFVSCGSGLVYAVVQSDPLFFLGQACLLYLYSRMQQQKYDENNKQ